MARPPSPNSLALSLKSLPVLTLSILLYYGAISRLTHGTFTPQIYAYQTYRQPDDNSIPGLVVPYIDLFQGTLLLLPSRTTRASAAAVFMVMQGIGLVMQVQAGKSWGPDVLLLLLGVGALQGARAP